MEKIIFDSELTIMKLLWQKGGMTAKEISEETREQTGWSKTTTYTVLKTCINKKLIKRTDPGFFCEPLVTEQEAQGWETDRLVRRLYHNSPELLMAELLKGRPLDQEKIEKLRNLINESCD